MKFDTESRMYKRRLLPLLAASPLMVLAAGGTLALSGCEERGPFEKAGEEIDEAVDDIGDALEDFGDDVKDEWDDR